MAGTEKKEAARGASDLQGEKKRGMRLRRPCARLRRWGGTNPYRPTVTVTSVPFRFTLKVTSRRDFSFSAL